VVLSTRGWKCISCSRPRCNQSHVYRETIELGFTNYSPQQIAFILQKMAHCWRGSKYDALKKNCCIFCRELSKRLCGHDFPAWVDRFAQIGKLISSPAGRALGINFTEMLMDDDEDECPRSASRHPASYSHPLRQAATGPKMPPATMNMYQPHNDGRELHMTPHLMQAPVMGCRLPAQFNPNAMPAQMPYAQPRLGVEPVRCF